MHKIIPLISFSTFLLAQGVVVPDDYLISDGDKLSYVYSGENASLIVDMKTYQEKIVEAYEKEYGFKLDDKLYVGIASQNNQIANGFSTQFPFNSQLFYGAGAGLSDYFCATSWLKTLVIHETAHNFQLNPKENEISRISHKVFGNTPFTMLGILPLFPVPNVTESSFVLEGNAVMNESRYGNGGRLFSGYALAEVVALAKAGVIRPELMYNSTLEFPYGEKFYLVGGFFQQFLVERYGVEKVNGYFKTYATQSFPFFTNWMFEEQYGKNFEVLLEEFVEEVKKEHQSFKTSEGKVVARSQFFTPLNVKDDEVYTLIGDRKSAPKILKFDKKNKKITYKSGSWLVGEVFKIENEYYVQSSAKTSPTKIEMGLFSENARLLKGEGSKVVQGFKPDGKEVYFDVKASIENPHVYVDGEFYTQSHSSVYVDKKGDLYYFKQEGEKRILYKNKTALFDYEGHYGFVTDVDERGAVYFIASTKHGSSAYKFADGASKRVTEGDDVIEFKLVGEKEALVVTIGSEGYAYRLMSFDNSVKSALPYYPHYEGALENSTLQKTNFTETSESLKSKPYKPLTQLRYSSLNQAMSYGSYEGFGLDIQANFSDPLLQNSLSAILSYNEQRVVGGLRYDNQAHQLEFGGAAYGVKHDENDFRRYEERDYGYEAYLNLPFLASGYWRANASLAYTKAYDNIYREPLTLSLDIYNHKQYGFSKYANELNELSFFATKDRESTIVGGTYAFKHDLFWQSYVGAKGTYMKSDEVNGLEEKGIEVSDGFSALQSDQATLNMPSISRTYYAKEAKMAELSLSKVFDASLYFYSLPLSLQRESLYVKQRFYDIDFTDSVNRQYNESTIGMEFDLLFLHNTTIPLKVEWIYNEDVIDKEQVKFMLGVPF